MVQCTQITVYAGKFYCSSYGETLLRVLGEMLEHDDLEVYIVFYFQPITTILSFIGVDLSQIRSYVNGTLYSLLSSSALREEARKMVDSKLCNVHG